MPYKKIIPYIKAEGEINANLIRLAKRYSDEGADMLLLYNFSEDEEAKEDFLKLSKEIAGVIDIPFIIGCNVNNFDDIKRALYTGACGIMISFSLIKKQELIKEAAGRFGNDKIYLEVDQATFLETDNLFELCNNLGIGTLIIKQVDSSLAFNNILKQSPLNLIINVSNDNNDIINLLKASKVMGITSDYFKDNNILRFKHNLKKENISVNVFESKFSFSDFKLNDDGLIPVITQDYRTGQVLMLAYMNEEAYNRTITEGIMTYYSRSRKCLWLKGETSGNYQYVKEIFLDCDKDTLLAKVLPHGPACHTGNNTCFYTGLFDKEHKARDSYGVLQSVYDVIMDRKKNPKEGSYTNYLFEKGIDKILKKCGEEAAEIIIAAKNPETGELRYEIADFIYHLMVLMVQC